MTKLKFIFSGEERTSEFELTYRLFENSFTKKWLKAFKKDLMDKKRLRENLFFGSLFESEEKLITEMNLTIEKINLFKPTIFTFKKKAFAGMTHQDLMLLHAEFEYAETLNVFRQNAPKRVISDLLKVNELIHRYQATLEQCSEFHINCIFENPETYDFELEDLELFSPHYYDGWLYLDYGTTGVTVFDAYRFNTPQKPVPQTRYQTGCKLLFDGNRERTAQEMLEIKKWMKNRWDLDAENPWNTLGYIPLGSLFSPSPRAEIEAGLKDHHKSFRVEVIESEEFR